MALNSMILHSWLLLLSLLYVSLIPVCHSQSSSPQNIETFYPYEAPTPTPPPEPPRASPEPPPVVSRGSSSNSKIAKAVAATAAATLVVSGLIFFVIHRCLRKRRREEAAIVPQTQINGLERIEGNVRGLIVDENGLDVVYWTKFQGRSSKRDFIKEVFRRTKKKERQEEAEEEEEGKNSESFQDFPLLRGKSSTSHINILPEEDESNRYKPRIGPPASVIPKRNSSAPSLPPPQPVPSRKNPPPPPPRQPPSLKSSSKRPPTSHETPTTNGGSRNSSGEGMSVSSNGQVKLRPLHWDKANTHADHSLLRDKADRGSFG